jgi:hypothetical protein
MMPPAKPTNPMALPGGFIKKTPRPFMTGIKKESHFISSDFDIPGRSVYL